MTGKHIPKKNETEWVYPDHEELFLECGLFDIETYIERQRGTLRAYLEAYRKELLVEAESTKFMSGILIIFLWWKQKIISKNEMKELKYFCLKK